VSQAAFRLNPAGPIEWVPDDRWGLLSKCGRFAIRKQVIDGQTEFAVWRRGPDGRSIPKWLGEAHTKQAAMSIAEEALQCSR